MRILTDFTLNRIEANKEKTHKLIDSAITRLQDEIEDKEALIKTIHYSMEQTRTEINDLKEQLERLKRSQQALKRA